MVCSHALAHARECTEKRAEWLGEWIIKSVVSKYFLLYTSTAYALELRDYINRALTQLNSPTAVTLRETPLPIRNSHARLTFSLTVVQKDLRLSALELGQRPPVLSNIFIEKTDYHVVIATCNMHWIGEDALMMLHADTPLGKVAVSISQIRINGKLKVESFLSRPRNNTLCFESAPTVTFNAIPRVGGRALPSITSLPLLSGIIDNLVNNTLLGPYVYPSTYLYLVDSVYESLGLHLVEEQCEKLETLQPVPQWHSMRVCVVDSSIFG
jgi:hypothetical protein